MTQLLGLPAASLPYVSGCLTGWPRFCAGWVLGISTVAHAAPLPRTCVLEANATWGAGLNGCEPMEAALCIAAATFASPG